MSNQCNVNCKRNYLLEWARCWKTVCNLPLLILAEDGSIVYNSEETDTEKCERFMEWYRAQGMIEHRIFLDGNTYAYGICTDDDNNVYILGPVKVYESDSAKDCCFDNLHAAWYGDADHLYKSNFCQIKSDFFIMCRSATGKIFPESDIFDEKFDCHFDAEIQDYQLQTVENEWTRNTYKEVADLIDTLRRGDLNSYYRLQDETIIDRVGKLANSSFKQNEYLTVKIFSLYMHAIIDGGVDYNKAYDLSDVYMQHLEKCTNVIQIQELQRKYISECISMIESEMSRERFNNIVEQAKSYVQRRVNKKITVSEMAKELNVNASYLSRCFSKAEGKTLQQYILQEKIRASCHMLRHSDYSISYISNYLYFSSDSHFCKAFRSVTGITPTQYRCKNYSFSKEFEFKFEG